MIDLYRRPAAEFFGADVGYGIRCERPVRLRVSATDVRPAAVFEDVSDLQVDGAHLRDGNKHLCTGNQGRLACIAGK
jgi:hypothetical protein